MKKPGRFRKKPVVIEAMQITLDTCGHELRAFTRNADIELADTGDAFIIPTLEGRMIASVGDWVIVGIKGEAYPCRGDIFAETYEEVT